MTPEENHNKPFRKSLKGKALNKYEKKLNKQMIARMIRENGKSGKLNSFRECMGKTIDGYSRRGNELLRLHFTDGTFIVINASLWISIDQNAWKWLDEP
jgi:hypothetical protein